MLFDSHAHINNDGFKTQDRARIINEIEVSNVSHVMDVGFDITSSQLAIKHASIYDWCYAAVGIHPSCTKTFTQAQFEILKGLLSQKKVKALGEIGLDYHYDNTDKKKQQFWFREQIRLANELKMPIVIHERDCHDDLYRILKEEGAFSKERAGFFPPREDENGNEERDVRILFHCFSGSTEVAREYIKEGSTLSIAGPVTYKNNVKTVRVVKDIPLEYLLIETDMPYLTPVPFRGKQNNCPNVEYVARKIAEIKNIEYEKVAKKTSENAKRFFDID